MAIKKFACLECGEKTVGVMTDSNSIKCPRCGASMVVVEVVRQ